MHLKAIATAILCCLPLCGQSPAAPSTSNPPNVVLIFADDLGYGDLGCYGAIKVKTPNIDRLAREGRRFTDAHSASAVCTPSRYALLTGEYPFRCGKKGIWGPIFHKIGLIIDTGKLTMGQVFKDAGYATACFGKWHLGFGKTPCDWNKPLRPGPLELGFDHYFGVPVVNSHPPFVYVEDDRIVGWDPGDPMIPSKTHPAPTPLFPEKNANPFGGAKKAHALYHDTKTATLLTEKAVAWIEQHKDRPFFLYFPTTNIHHPFTPAPRFQGTSGCGRYGDFIHELDWMVGEILQTLDELKLAQNTLVIFTSDNGGMLNQGGQDAVKAGHRLNGDLLGFKFDAWEGGHREPFLARWPGHIPAGTESSQLLCHVDLLATFAALVDRPLGQGDAPDSINVLSALKGNPEKTLRDTVIIAPSREANLAIRQGDWIYIGARGGGGFTGTEPGDHLLGGPAALKFAGQTNSDVVDGRFKPDAPGAQLYNLATDPRQQTNVIREHPEVAARLKSLLRAQRRR